MIEEAPVRAELTTAQQVRDALHKRWPDSDYLHIYEAPDGASRQGRKIDVLVVTLWQSRGYKLDAVEIKVSMADYRKEIAEPGKADYWWRHSHRYWIAMPAALAAKAKPDLPPTWGLLAVDADKTKVLVEADRRDAEPLGWQGTVGLLRATADCGFAALRRAEERGIDRGTAQTKAHFEKHGGDKHVRDELERLRGQVAEFEAASGVKLDRYADGDKLGRIVALVRKSMHDPERVQRGLASARQLLLSEAEAIERLAAALVDESPRGE